MDEERKQQIRGLGAQLAVMAGPAEPWWRRGYTPPRQVFAPEIHEAVKAKAEAKRRRRRLKRMAEHRDRLMVRAINGPGEPATAEGEALVMAAIEAAAARVGVAL